MFSTDFWIVGPAGSIRRTSIIRTWTRRSGKPATRVDPIDNNHVLTFMRQPCAIALLDADVDAPSVGLLKYPPPGEHDARSRARESEFVQLAGNASDLA